MFYVNYLSIKPWKKRLSPKNQMSWSLHHNNTTNNITASFGTKSDQPANTSSKCSLYGVNKISLRENKENFWSLTTPQWKPFSKWDFPSNLTHFQSTRVVFRIPKNPLEHVKFLPWLFFPNHIKSKFIIEKETQIGKLGPLWSELCLPIQLVIPSPNHSTPYPSFVRFMKYCQLPNTVTF